VGAALRVTEERSPGLAGDVAVVEEYLPLYLEDQPKITAEELRRAEAAIGHLVSEQRKALQEGA